MKNGQVQVLQLKIVIVNLWSRPAPCQSHDPCQHKQWWPNVCWMHHRNCNQHQMGRRKRLRPVPNCRWPLQRAHWTLWAGKMMARSYCGKYKCHPNRLWSPWNHRQQPNSRNWCRWVVLDRNVWNLKTNHQRHLHHRQKTLIQNRNHWQQQRPPVRHAHQFWCVPGKPLRLPKSVRNKDELPSQTIVRSTKIQTRLWQWRPSQPASICTPNERMTMKHRRMQRNRRHKLHCQRQSIIIANETVTISRHRRSRATDGGQQQQQQMSSPQQLTALEWMKSNPVPRPWHQAHRFYLTKCWPKLNRRFVCVPCTRWTIIPKMDKSKQIKTE